MLRSHLSGRPQGLLMPTPVRLFSQFNRKNKRRQFWLAMSPHITVAIILAATSNLSLIAVPLTTAAVHYMYKYNHIKQMTLYMDM